MSGGTEACFKQHDKKRVVYWVLRCPEQDQVLYCADRFLEAVGCHEVSAGLGWHQEGAVIHCRDNVS